jgi:starch-binding outer membrane protein SusE/F
MKKIFKLLLPAVALVMAFTGCKKEENKIFFQGGTAPVLSANRTGTIPLSFINANQEAVKLGWTNPNYKLTTGLSSQDVFYRIEIDTTNAAGTLNPNFTNPKKQVLTVSKELDLSLTQNQLNDYLLNQL